MEESKNFRVGTLSDVYKYIQNSRCFMPGDSGEESMDLLWWFLKNYSSVGENPVSIWSDDHYYCGNHAHEEWEIFIAKIDTPWGKCVKVIESYYDYAFYSYDNSGYYHEEIFMFVKE